MHLPLDIDRFWKDDARAHADNCFSPDAPQVALGIGMSEECVYAELGEPGTPWAPMPRARRLTLIRRYNDKAERVVGRRLLHEQLPPEDCAFTGIRRIGEVFGGRYFYHNDTEWLEGELGDARALERKLDEVEKLDLREFLLPADWQAQKTRLFECYGVRPPRARGIRGPITLAGSLMGPENMIYAIVDAPELMARFAQVIADVAIGIARIMDAEAGDPESAARGYSFADDNCCLLNPEMYQILGYPVLRRAFETFSPDPGDSRYQHSDSAMGHLLPLLGTLNLTGVNFGPTVLVDDIRRSLPRARIDGCIAPFTFMRNDTEGLTRECLRDFEMARATGRGLNLSTAGSINNGSSLESLRHIMALIQNRGRY